MTTTAARKNGLASGWGASSLIIRQRRSKSVQIPGTEASVLVKAMTAGERRQFIQIGTTPPDDAPEETKERVRRWYSTGLHDRILLALSLYEGDEPMFPDAREEALRYIHSDGNINAPKLVELEDVDPAAEVLLLQAAMDVSLITVASLNALLNPEAGKTGPLATTSETSTDSPQT